MTVLNGIEKLQVRMFSVKSHSKSLEAGQKWPKELQSTLWKSGCPKKVAVFSWIVLFGNLNTTDVLQKKTPFLVPSTLYFSSLFSKLGLPRSFAFPLPLRSKALGNRHLEEICSSFFCVLFLLLELGLFGAMWSKPLFQKSGLKENQRLFEDKRKVQWECFDLAN